MIKANIAEAKNTFSALIRKVKRGETVLIMDRNEPVAQIVPLSKQFSPKLLELASKGIIKLPTSTEPYLGPVVDLGERGSLLEAVLAEREEGW
jgi:prevent-host-death family protein